jgi:hypothetical protein
MHVPIKVKSSNNISKWQMEFNSAFKGLIVLKHSRDNSAIQTQWLSYTNSFKPGFYLNKIKNSFCNRKETQQVSFKKTLRLISIRETVAVYSKNHAKQVNILKYFLDSFAFLRSVTASFIISVCPSVRFEQLGSHCTHFHEILYFRIYWKSVDKVHVSLKSDKNDKKFTII